MLIIRHPLNSRFELSKARPSVLLWHFDSISKSMRSNQARSQDVKFGGAKLFLEGQLPTQTENVNTNTKKSWYNVICKSMSKWTAIFFKKVLNLSV